MKKKTSFFLTLLFIFTSLSCDRETCCDDPIEEITFTPPSSESFNILRQQALEQNIQNETFIAEEGIDFTSSNGAQLQIFPGCLTTLDGELILDEVELEFIEFYSRYEMLGPNKPTMGRMPDGNKAMLLTGGAFYINITRNGEDVLPVCGIQLIVPTSLTGGPDEDMTLWTGVIDDNDNLTWEANPNGEAFVEGDNYFTFFQGFGWTNIDRFFDDPRPKTTLQVLVTEGYTAQNASIYLSFDGEETGLAHLDTFNPDTHMFSEHYGQLPVGLEVHLIFVTAEDNLWRYAIKPVTITENGFVTIAHSETQTATLEELQTLIAGLP
tara:strand:+ start:7549 stop:8520 length:972 start_codon:yes stop_codon:yes gene_type:complete